MERYFISYSVTIEDASGFGNLERTTNRKITGINAIKDIAREIENDLGFESGSVVILSFQRFDQ